MSLTDKEKEEAYKSIERQLVDARSINERYSHERVVEVEEKIREVREDLDKLRKKDGEEN